MINILKNAIIAVLALFVAALYAAPAAAEADLAAGNEIAYSCLGCHGIEGYRNAYPSYRVPKLGGQKAAYIAIALQGYRDGTRQHPTMQAQASSLSDQDIENVAAYIASLAGDNILEGTNDNAAFDTAKTCVACHGQAGVSVNAVWPTLAGQHEDYLEKSLHQYRDGSRGDAVMAAQAALIKEEDIAVLARYYAGLEGLETTLPE